MHNIFRNKRLITLVICIVFVLSTLGTVFVSFAKNGKFSLKDVFGKNISTSSKISSIATSGVLPLEKDQISYNKPAKMLGSFVNMGVDYFTKPEMKKEEIIAEIGLMLDSMKTNAINTVTINTWGTTGVIYRSTILKNDTMLNNLENDFDVVDTIIKKAREHNMYVYLQASVFNKDLTNNELTDLSFNDKTYENIEKRFIEIGRKYKVDGVFLTDYYNPKTIKSYSAYKLSGDKSGFDNWSNQVTRYAVSLAVETLKTVNKGAQVGIICDEVWANSTTNEKGSPTQSPFEMLIQGSIDIKKLIEDDLFNFVFVKSTGSLTDTAIPFESVVTWWDTIAKQNSFDLYFVLASSKAVTTNVGWNSPDQLTRQSIVLKKYQSSGIVFDSLKRLLENPQNSTQTFLKSLNQGIDENFIFKDLVFQSPAKTAITTYATGISLSGAADINFPLLYNGKDVKLSTKGLFDIWHELTPGANKISFEHKGKVVTFNITRKIKVIESVNPTGVLRLDGGLTISIEAMAYRGSNISAIINKQPVNMAPTNDDVDPTSTYCKYKSEYTLPSSTTSERDLGKIVVSGNWKGMKETVNAAQIIVNKYVPPITNGSTVKVTALEAETFPWSPINDYSVPTCYPLPKNTVDYIVGSEIPYSDETGSFKYYNLASGKRVYTKDVQIAKIEGPENNEIDEFTATSDGRFTYLTFDMRHNVPYDFSLSPLSFTSPYIVESFTPTKVAITFKYSVKFGSVPSFSGIPLFSSGAFEKVSNDSVRLNLQLSKPGAFLGFNSYYDTKGNLVFRFNNISSIIPTAEKPLNGARIALDPGHSYLDCGAVNKLYNVSEYSLNARLSVKIKEVLESNGASVFVVPSDTTNPSMPQRLAWIKDFNPHLMVSIHHNSASSTAASGPESYYYNPFSSELSRSIFNRVYNYYRASIGGSSARGSKFNYFAMNREYTFPSTLVEYGFMSNSTEVDRIRTDTVQQGLAEATVQGVIDFINTKK